MGIFDTIGSYFNGDVSDTPKNQEKPSLREDVAESDVHSVVPEKVREDLMYRKEKLRGSVKGILESDIGNAFGREVERSVNRLEGLDFDSTNSSDYLKLANLETIKELADGDFEKKIDSFQKISEARPSKRVERDLENAKKLLEAVRGGKEGLSKIFDGEVDSVARFVPLLRSLTQGIEKDLSSKKVERTEGEQLLVDSLKRVSESLLKGLKRPKRREDRYGECGTFCTHIVERFGDDKQIKDQLKSGGILDMEVYRGGGHSFISVKGEGDVIYWDPTIMQFVDSDSVLVDDDYGFIGTQEELREIIKTSTDEGRTRNTRFPEVLYERTFEGLLGQLEWDKLITKK